MSKIKISAELSHVCPLTEIVRQAKVLEDKGFHRVWVPDTIVSPWEAWLAASLVIQNTSRLRIGLGVTNPYTRHPVVMAQMACTLQALSQGRLSLSIGKGMARFLEKAGIRQYEKALEECVTIIRHLTSGERFSLEGEVFRLDAIRLRLDPPENKIPIYMAAIGPSGTKPDFFPNQLQSVEMLARRIAELEDAGFDEIIIAYGDMKDLELVSNQLGG